jgi:hypothetical protein
MRVEPNRTDSKTLNCSDGWARNRETTSPAAPAASSRTARPCWGYFDPWRSIMAIKTIPLSRLETDLEKTLNECAESGQTLVVEMPDQRLLAIQPLEPQEDDALMDELLASNWKFQALVAKSKAGPRKPFSIGQ